MIIAPSTGPTQGDQPAEKNTPIKLDERKPILRSGIFWMRVSYSKNGMRNTPIICRPKIMMMNPADPPQQDRKVKQYRPQAKPDEIEPNKDHAEPEHKKTPCKNVTRRSLSCASPPAARPLK